MNSDDILARLRQFLLIISAGVFVMTVTELVFLGHWNETIQFLPFALSTLGLTTIALVYFRPSHTSLTVMRWSMIVIGMCSFIGFYMHLAINYRFWLEIEPGATTWELIKATLEGGNPALAPGILLLGAVIGLAAIYRHPLLDAKQSVFEEKIMRRFIILTLSLASILSACTAPGEMEVHQAWVRPTAQGENAAVYLTIHNHSANDDELTGGTTNVTDAVEIHESKMENDVMQMSMVNSLPIIADEEIIFTPGGLHLMLTNVKEELVLGEHIGLVLHFKNHEDIVVEVHVEDSMPEEDHE